MAGSMPFVIRPARAADKQAVLAFCAHTFDWGDYLPEVWDEWLADARGQLLVATLDEVPVGVAKVTLLTPGEAWLEGLRVNLARTQTQRAGVEAEIGRLNREKEEQGRQLSEIAREIENTRTRIGEVVAQSAETEKEKVQIAEEEKAASALTGKLSCLRWKART